jgi:hypothetical protein
MGGVKRSHLIQVPSSKGNLVFSLRVGRKRTLREGKMAKPVCVSTRAVRAVRT